MGILCQVDKRNAEDQQDGDAEDAGDAGDDAFQADSLYGHCELDLIDRIQIRCRELYGVTVYPRHDNGLEFQANDEMISVGIGPLSYSDRYVHVGEPHPSLKGDLKFLAKQMRLKLPPLPVAGRKEVKMFTDFMISCSGKPKESDFANLAHQYLVAADGIDIFPKLPTMVRSYFNRWKKNQMIKAAKDSVGTAAKNLLLKLSGSAAVPEDHYCVEAMQVEESKTSGEHAIVGGNSGKESTGQADLFVPPVAAPGQLAYKPAANKKNAAIRCVWAPFCTKRVGECNGYNYHSCIYRKQFQHISPEELLRKKTEMRNLEKRQRAAQKRQEKQQEAPNA